jgi:hypothetical protein
MSHRTKTRRLGSGRGIIMAPGPTPDGNLEPLESSKSSLASRRSSLRDFGTICIKLPHADERVPRSVVSMTTPGRLHRSNAKNS